MKGDGKKTHTVSKGKTFPANFFTGKLTEEELDELDKECDIHCPSVFRDGSATYSIRYRGKRI